MLFTGSSCDLSQKSCTEMLTILILAHDDDSKNMHRKSAFEVQAFCEIKSLFLVFLISG